MTVNEPQGPPLPDEHGIEILRCEVGSTLHGTGLPGGEDHDEMGIALEWPRTTIGLGQHEQWQHRTAQDGERSQPGDVDLVVYTARKWAKLALNGNPTVLLPLFAPYDKVLIESVAGAVLRERRGWFVSKRAGAAFLGYLEQQRQRLTGERGSAGRIRPRGKCPVCQGRVASIVGETVSVDRCEECGGSGLLPDWKYAMHMLRLGHQGVEFLYTGVLTLPVPGALGDHLRAVRRGEIPLKECLAEAESLEVQMKRQLSLSSPLPDEPNTAAVEEWLISAHRHAWMDRDGGPLGSMFPFLRESARG